GDNNQRGPNTPRRVNSLGSGFVIDASGVVVTNNHVISEADEVTVILNDGSRLKAEIIGRDQKTDLALLRVKPEKPLKAVKFGDSENLRLGEWVIAIGNPFSLGGSVTAGIVPGDVIVKFDGKDIKEMRDLPRVVADTPVGKQTPVVIIRKGKEDTKVVTLGRLEDGEKVAAADPKDNGAPEKPVVKKTLGLELAKMTDDLRLRYKI